MPAAVNYAFLLASGTYERVFHAGTMQCVGACSGMQRKGLGVGERFYVAK